MLPAASETWISGFLFSANPGMKIFQFDQIFGTISRIFGNSGTEIMAKIQK
jgi:hypothetical protein